MLLVAAVLCSAPLGAQLKLINKSPGSQREPRSLARPCGWGDGGAGEVGEGWAGEMSHSSVLLSNFHSPQSSLQSALFPFIPISLNAYDL